MLDFYLISGDSPSPEYPEKLKLDLCFSLDFRTFQNLQKKNIISNEVHFFSDFRWTSSNIQQMLALIESQYKSDTETYTISKGFKQALESKVELIAFGD